MDLALSPDEAMLRDAVMSYARDYREARSASLAEPTGCRETVWQDMAGLGWLGVGLPEAVGGFGLGPVAEMLVHEGVGAGLITEPVLAAAMGARLLALAGLPEQRVRWLDPALAGTTRIVAAHDEPGMRGRDAPIVMQAELNGEDWRLTGTKGLVTAAPAADILLVSARHGDETLLIAVTAEEARQGEWRACRTIDGGSAAKFRLAGLRVDADRLVARGGAADAALALTRDHAIVAGCAEAVGAMDAAILVVRDHLTTRRQFGQPLAAFQALQHRYADMILAAEQARSILLYGVAAIANGDANARARGVSAAKLRCVDSARFVAAQAVQLHGGIGVTEEHIISHYFRRLTMFAQSFGGPDIHLARYIAAPSETVLWD